MINFVMKKAQFIGELVLHYSNTNLIPICFEILENREEVVFDQSDRCAPPKKTKTKPTNDEFELFSLKIKD